MTVQLTISPAAARALLRARPRRKYGNEITEIDGISFHSKGEARRWTHLQGLEKFGFICDLKRQVRFPFDVNGVRIGVYTADFTYTEIRSGEPIVEDFKSTATARTTDFRRTLKLMQACHGITVRVVKDWRA
jgi:hypothetical protein